MMARPGGGARTMGCAGWSEAPAKPGAPAGTGCGLAIARAALAAPELVAGPPEQPTRSRQAAAVRAAAAGAPGPRRVARGTAGEKGAGIPNRRVAGNHRAPPGA